MDRLVFTAMASLKQLNNMKLKYANALANASTVGFKQTFQFATETSQVAGPGFGTRYVPMNRSNDELVIDQGPLIATGRKLDIYLKGGTLLGAQASNGQVAFTRRGDLLVDQSGLLETANGHIVLGEGGGPITVPVGVDLAITNDGTSFETRNAAASSVVMPAAAALAKKAHAAGTSIAPAAPALAGQIFARLRPALPATLRVLDLTANRLVAFPPLLLVASAGGPKRGSRSVAGGRQLRPAPN